MPRLRRADPARGEVRVTFLGRSVEHAAHALSVPAGGFVPSFVEARPADGGQALLEAIAATDPDVVVAFAPERLPDGLLGELDAVTVGVLCGDGAELDALRPPALDRLVAWDADTAERAPQLAIWRSPPPAVDDALFAPPPAGPPSPHALFLGESTAHREAVLGAAKHAYDVSHYAFGLAGERLAEVLRAAGVGVVVHPAEGAPSFPPAAPLHLAAGHLLLAEPLVPSRGLEPGIDHLVFEAPDQLMTLLFQLQARPAAYAQVRLRARARAEGFRASRLWPRLLADLAPDLAAFGSPRS
jgi:hypothetical protein